eukprot:6907659-Prymnesium_polylepis.2
MSCHPVPMSLSSLCRLLFTASRTRQDVHSLSRLGAGVLFQNAGNLLLLHVGGVHILTVKLRLIFDAWFVRHAASCSQESKCSRASEFKAPGLGLVSGAMSSNARGCGHVIGLRHTYACEATPGDGGDGGGHFARMCARVAPQRLIFGVTSKSLTVVNRRVLLKNSEFRVSGWRQLSTLRA